MGPMTPPTPQAISTRGCCARLKLDRIMACPSGKMGAPKRPWNTRVTSIISKVSDIPANTEKPVNPAIELTIRLRQPKREASQPVKGVAMAVATRLKVMIHDT